MKQLRLFKTMLLMCLLLSGISNAWGEEVVIMQEDFSSITAGNNTSTSGSSSTWNGNTNFPIVNSKVYQAGGAIKLGASGSTGSITSRELDLSANGGKYIVEFDAKGWTTVETQIKVTPKYNDVFSSGKESAITATMTNNFEHVSLTFENGQSNSQLVFQCKSNGRVFIDNIKVYYVSEGTTPDPTTYTVTVANNIANGSVTASPTSAVAGATVNLTATPDSGYKFGSWNVTNASTNAPITVTGNKFTMPAANVNVSATFNEVHAFEGTVTKLSADDDADIKFITGSSSAANAFWANSTPLTANNITLSGTNGSSSSYSYYDGSVVRFYQNNTFTLTPTNGATIVKVEIVRQSAAGSNSGVISCSSLTASNENTTTNTNVFTGSATSAITFTNTAQCRFTKILVYTTNGKALQSIEVSGTPTKTTYDEGETFDPAGLTVTGTYDDGTTTPISDEDISWNITPETLVAGTTSVSVTATVGNITSPSYTVTDIVVNAFPTLTSIDDIFNKATEVGGDETKVRVVFGNWVVSGVSINGKNVYVTNGEKGFIIFNNGANMGFVAGDMLSGTAICKVLMYNQSAELKELSSTTEGLVVTKGGTVNPQHVETSQLSGINTGRVISFENISFDGTNFTDGTNTIKPYNQLYQYDNLAKDESYDVTGVYLRYRDDNEILPRDASDIERHSYTTSYTITIETPENGSISVTREDGTTVNSGDTAYQGEKILIHAEPNPGYRCETIDITSSTKTSFWGNDKLWTMGDFDITISATIVPIPTYTINWSVNGEIIKTDENVLEGTDLAAPADPVSELSFFTDYEFKGWVTDPNKVLPNTVPVFANTDKAVASTTYYAVFATKAGDGVDEWVRQTTVPADDNGEYLIVKETSEDALNVNAMKAATSSNRFDNGNVRVEGNVVIAAPDSEGLFPDASLIWKISKDGEYYSLYNESTGKYAGGTNTKNQGALLDDADTDLAKWSISYTGGTFEVINYGRSQAASDPNNKYLRNNGVNGWATYVSTTGDAPVFYKRIPGYTDFTVYPPLVLDEATETITKEYKGTYRRVKVKRTINTGNWNTLCLPFDMNEDQIADNLGDAEIYELTGLEMEGNYNVMVFEPVKTMEAGTPYMIRVPDAVSVINVENVFVDYRKDDFTSEATNGINKVIIHGSYLLTTDIPICERNADNRVIRRYFISKNGIFAPVISKSGVRGFRAYFEVPSAGTNSELVGMPTKITIKTDPTKTDYSDGGKFEPEGLVITSTYGVKLYDPNAEIEYDSEVSHDFSYAGFERCFTFNPDLDSPLTSDDQIVTVTFGGASTIVDISPRYTITYSVNGELHEQTGVSSYAGAKLLATVDPIADYTFAGWSLTEMPDEITSKPSFVSLSADGKFVPSEGTTLYAVYTRTVEDDGTSGEGVYRIYGNVKGTKHYMSTAPYQPAGSSVVSTAGTSTDVNDAIKYTITKKEGSTDQYSISFENGGNTVYLNMVESGTNKKNYDLRMQSEPYFFTFSEGAKEGTTRIISAVSDRALAYRDGTDYQVFKIYSTVNLTATSESYYDPTLEQISGTGTSYYTTFVGYTRKTTAGNYGTLCMPCAVKVGRFEGATLYSIGGRRTNGDAITSIVLTELDENEPLVAGRPYIFQATASEIKAHYNGPKAEAGSYNGLVGSLEDHTLDNYDGIYVISGNKVKKFKDGSTVVANRAYIDMKEVPDYDESSASAQAKIVEFGVEDGATGVSELSRDYTDGYIYNLNGQRVSVPVRGQIYIQNGNKFIAK